MAINYAPDAARFNQMEHDCARYEVKTGCIYYDKHGVAYAAIEDSPAGVMDVRVCFRNGNTSGKIWLPKVLFFQ